MVDLPDDPWFAIETVCDKFHDFKSEFIDIEYEEIDVEEYPEFLDFVALISAISTKHNIEIEVVEPVLKGSRHANMAQIIKYFGELSIWIVSETTRLRLAASTSRFVSRLPGGFYYELTEDEIRRIQDLINELRELIVKSKFFKEDYRRRLLYRLETLQSELHKKVSDVDRFWGLVGDAGVMLGKLGKEAKPIVDRIRELTEIIWKVQAKAEQLPEGTKFPLLTKDENN